MGLNFIEICYPLKSRILLRSPCAEVTTEGVTESLQSFLGPTKVKGELVGVTQDGSGRGEHEGCTDDVKVRSYASVVVYVSRCRSSSFPGTEYIDQELNLSSTKWDTLTCTPGPGRLLSPPVVLRPTPVVGCQTRFEIRTNLF